MSLKGRHVVLIFVDYYRTPAYLLLLLRGGRIRGEGRKDSQGANKETDVLELV